MLTSKLGGALWSRFARYTSEQLRTAAVQELARKAALLLEEREGKREADMFRNLLTVAENDGF